MYWACEKKLETDVQGHPGAMGTGGLNGAQSDDASWSKQWGCEVVGYEYGGYHGESGALWGCPISAGVSVRGLRKMKATSMR